MPVGRCQSFSKHSPLQKFRWTIWRGSHPCIAALCRIRDLLSRPGPQSRPSPGEVHAQNVSLLAEAKPVASCGVVAPRDSDLEASQCLEEAHAGVGPHWQDGVCGQYWN